MGTLKLTRPIVCFDLETTGVDPQTDRIVELSVLRVEPDGSRQSRTRRINPGRPIPKEATAVHGISDADVADQPTLTVPASFRYDSRATCSTSSLKDCTSRASA